MYIYIYHGYTHTIWLNLPMKFRHLFGEPRAAAHGRPLEEFPGAQQGPALVVEAAPYRPGDQAESEGATQG